MKQNSLHHIFEVENCKVNWPYSAANLADSGGTGLVLARSWLCTSDLSCLGSCSQCFSVPTISSFLSVVWLSGKQGSEVEPLSTDDCQEFHSLTTEQEHLKEKNQNTTAITSFMENIEVTQNITITEIWMRRYSDWKTLHEWVVSRTGCMKQRTNEREFLLCFSYCFREKQFVPNLEW